MSANEDSRVNGKWAGFLSRAVHELRTPLSSILMLAEMSDDDRIHHATTDVLALLAEISEYGKIEGGRIEIFEDEVTPQDLARKIEDDFRPKAQGQGITLKVSVDADVPASLRGDLKRIEQVASGLLGHAIHAAAGRVEVQLRRGPGDGLSSDSLNIQITDDGPAVPEEQRETFFEPLLHTRPGSRRQHGGQSLGLAIAEALARRLGGEVTLTAGTSGTRDTSGNVLTWRLRK